MIQKDSRDKDQCKTKKQRKKWMEKRRLELSF